MDISNTTVATYTLDDPSWLGSEHGTDSTESITLDTSAFTSGTHYPSGFFTSGIPLGKITATGKYGPYGGRANEQQTITLTAAAGGTFTVTFDGETTGNIAYNATAATVQTALLTLSNINTGDVAVTGEAGGPYTVEFTGQYAAMNVPAVTVADSTTGEGHSIAVATAVAGGSTVSDGRETLVGFLYGSVQAPSSTSIDVGAAMLTHGKIREARLPVAVDAAGKADVAGRIRFV